MNSPVAGVATASLPEVPVCIPADAYISPGHARLEAEKLWPKVWQMACRIEELPKGGSFYTYDILDESIIVVRTAADKIKAYFNVCQHRGRRLTEGCGHTQKLYCRFHGWTWNLDGENTNVLDRKDWDGALNPENLRLGEVLCDTWGGYVFINMDPNAEPLKQYLEPVTYWLDPFEIDKMRYRWRKWRVLDCNWKTAIEAFIEGYHVAATHPQLLEWSDDSTWSRAHGKHSNFGTPAGDDPWPIGSGSKRRRQEPRTDVRQGISDFFTELYSTLDAVSTQTILKAAQRLPTEVPEGTPPYEVIMSMMTMAATEDAAQGVYWPNVDPMHYMESGIDWHVFPNIVILHGPTFVLGYRARPNGLDPNSCIFEVYTLDRFAEGKEPPTPENQHCPEVSEAVWGKILCQDFSNMSQVQKGMHSRGFKGSRPSPKQEVPVTNFHRNLASYLGTGEPVPLIKP